MEHIDYLSGENTVPIENQQVTGKVKVLFMSADITLEQLAEIIYNSYLRKHPALIEGSLLNNKAA
jgi:hypothetical protein